MNNNKEKWGMALIKLFWMTLSNESIGIEMQNRINHTTNVENN